MRAVAALLLLSSLPAAAGTLDLEGRFSQGGLIVGRTDPGAEILLDGRQLRVSPDGRFAFGFGREHGPDATLEARFSDGSRETRHLSIAGRRYDVQRIDGLPPKMVTPDPKVLARIRREGALIAAVRRLDNPETWFAGDWIWPSRGPITGVYGSQRILNGEPRRPHYGIDVAAPAGSPVVAPTDAVVALAETDLYYTGGTVMLDHGHGVTSVYSHLKDVAVRVGDRIRQGDLIGTVGSSGRATGPHLDWRINWFKERLDPALLVGPMPPS